MTTHTVNTRDSQSVEQPPTIDTNELWQGELRLVRIVKVQSQLVRVVLEVTGFTAPLQLVLLNASLILFLFPLYQ